jgi:PAS domain S-box-containing protein
VELEMQNDEIRRTQAELETALVKYTDLYDFAPVAYLTLDQSGLVLEANLTAARLLGTERGRLAQQPLAPFIWPEDKQKFRAYLSAVVQGHAAPPLEMNLQGKGGKVTVQLDSLLVPGAGGKPRVRISLVDIMARKQAEEALQELQHRYLTLFQAAADAIFINDLEGRLLEVNEEACRRLGYSREELLHLTVSDVTSPDYVARRPEILKQLCAAGHLVFESELVTRDGQIIPSECSSRMMDLQGQTAVLSISRDISERQAAAARLRESQEKLQSIFRAAPVGMGLVFNRVIQEANETLCRMTGYAREELLGQNARLLYATSEDYEYVGREKYRQIAQRGTGSVETRWQRKNGDIIDIILSSTPLDKSDLSNGVTFTALDITDRKRAERALQEALSLQQATLESSADGILAVDLHGRIMVYNNKFLEMWGVPKTILETRDVDQALAAIQNELADPEQFHAGVRKAYDQPELATYSVCQKFFPIKR